jgi:hypothetical protein
VTLPARLNRLISGRVNPLIPGVVCIAGFAIVLRGNAFIGTGLVVGAGLAVVNAVLLSRRVEFAADLQNVSMALMVMQIGLLVTCTIVGVTTVVLIHYSLSMAIAAAAGFAATYLAMLGIFAVAQGRARATSDRNFS